MPHNNEESKIQMRFVPPAKPTEFQLQLNNLKGAIALMQDKERAEVYYVAERIRFLLTKYPRTAEVACVLVSMEIGVDQGR